MGGNKDHDDVQGETKASSMANITVDKDTLQLIQLDYHGVIDNLSTCILRCSTPKGTTLADCWDRLIVTPKDWQLAPSLGLVPHLPISSFPSISKDSTVSNGNKDDNYGNRRLLFALYWVISICDNPLLPITHPPFFSYCWDFASTQNFIVRHRLYYSNIPCHLLLPCITNRHSHQKWATLVKSMNSKKPLP